MAEITPTKSDDRTPVVTWTPVTNGDTFGEASIPGGEYVLECTGTFDTAVVDFRYGSTSGATFAIDTDTAPDGARFSAAGAARITLPSGFVDATFSTGGGGSESITLRLLPALNNKI